MIETTEIIQECPQTTLKKSSNIKNLQNIGIPLNENTKPKG